ncbi:hypothetical protein AAMO2058_001467900 [Amorphochlora amoebiformis]
MRGVRDCRTGAAYVFDDDGKFYEIQAAYGYFRGILPMVKDLFLPKGYPNSVTPDYIAYQSWDTIQALCSYLRGVLATRAWFQGIGVGSAKASASAATYNWILKDGCGMIGSLFFASVFGRKFDSNVKSWRLFADMINNVGLFLDMLAPLAGDYFIYVACIATVCKALCGVAAGATKAALTGHFALNNNSADVQAKETSQETFVTLIGLVLGSFLASYTTDSPFQAWGWFLVLTVIHMISNTKGVRCLRIPSLSQTRFRILFDRYIIDKPLLSVEEMSVVEPIFLPLLEGFYKEDIEIGSNFLDCFPHKSEWMRLRAIYKGERYIVKKKSQNMRDKRLTVILLAGASDIDISKSYFNALSLRSQFLPITKLRSPLEFYIKRCKKFTDSKFDDFLEKARGAGWRVDRCVLDAGASRFEDMKD